MPFPVSNLSFAIIILLLLLVLSSMYYVVTMPSSVSSNSLLRKTKYIIELIIYNLQAANLLHNTPFGGCLCWPVMVIGLSSSVGL